ncbi:cation:proton antiporter [Paraliobacillus salinarum]|uniref:cation:proton antiporter n=1 Tax=Paraliobacillus salinarum TaxID=1158996 RepID=UPI0015F63921|nr:sodium:proton antiporter [Paraliobacillus salinarum]
MEIGHLIWLLLIGFIIFTLDKKQENFPVPTVLLLTGIVLSFIPYFSSVEITSDMIYNVFLPPLLFVSAYQFSPKSLKRNFGLIIFLATVGLLVTVALLGGAIFAFGHTLASLSLLGSFVIAAMLTPTDPVSVVSILKKSTDDERIASVVDGESMLNDGTSIVVFTVLSSMFINQTSPNIFDFLEEFLYVSVGGAGLGIILGWLMSKGVHYTHHRDYQIMLSIVLAFGSFHLAEFFHVSGVLATVSAGIMLSFEYAKSTNESKFKTSLNSFWEIVELSITSLLFLLIGIEMTHYLIFDYWLFAIITFLITIGIRYIIILGASRLFSNWRHTNWRMAFIVSWAGLKGTMSIFLILSLFSKQTSNPEIDSIVSISFAVVLLSLVIQSFGIYPLSKKLSK